MTLAALAASSSQNDPCVKEGYGDGSTLVQEYKTRHGCPFGYQLCAERDELLGEMVAARDFLKNNMATIKKETPKAAPIMVEILATYNEILK